ncbi:MAG: choice-of-anchor G family protein [Propionibacteriales bacterium]|nr:choice-of-anchor G family protein [Propionibacteriales bacterium]
MALGLAFACLVPTVASAAPVVSQSNGRLLDIDGAVGGLTDVVAELRGAVAVNSDASGDVIVDKPLNASVLSSLELTSTGVNLLGDNGIIQLGAVGQYARANDDGSSVAFSGGVSNASSLIGVGAGEVTPSDVGSPDGNASISLSTKQILGGTTDLVKLGIDVGALAASAEQTVDGKQTGKYVLADVGINVGGTAVQPTGVTLYNALNTLLQAAKVAGLTLPNPLKADGSVALTEEDLLAAAGVSSLNELPPNTDLLQYVPAAVVKKLTTSVNDILDAVQAKVDQMGPLAGAILAAALRTARNVINPVLNGLGTTVEGPLAAAIKPLAALVVNGKSTGEDGSFTQTALRVQLGPNGSLATVDLASATVGPNAGEMAVPLAGPESLSVGGAVIALAAVVGFVVIRRRRTEQNSAVTVGKGV